MEWLCVGGVCGCVGGCERVCLCACDVRVICVLSVCCLCAVCVFVCSCRRIDNPYRCPLGNICVFFSVFEQLSIFGLFLLASENVCARSLSREARTRKRRENKLDLESKHETCTYALSHAGTPTMCSCVFAFHPDRTHRTCRFMEETAIRVEASRLVSSSCVHA